MNTNPEDQNCCSQDNHKNILNNRYTFKRKDS